MGIEIAGMGFVLGILSLLVILIGLGLRTYQAKTISAVHIARDDAYRKLAEDAVAVQQKTAKDLAELRARVTEIERLLREVE